ncbi:hypothetical protein H310_14638 [Aphanomyces invadans]|uniref:Uncharacterized protein n=1 Tax=Aphanomyces invadans TaxID=157072 RepID=A0A024TB77_9STRA|nr:hypothetical protein H310_14638 [Aphanomyces invadans]ETV90602.1 hypothetical protein H310_14638 [Aphanomyces invadans]|eukprot:XP_008880755.1 hypothetical protein H310_14638 [Aphanomyces invadans]
MFKEDGKVDLASLAQFPRYEEWLRLDEEYQVYRNDLCMLIPQLMDEIAKHVTATSVDVVTASWKTNGEYIKEREVSDAILNHIDCWFGHIERAMV